MSSEKFLPYLYDAEKSNFQTSIINVINNRHDAINDAIIRHALDTKDKHILANPNSLQATFKDIKKFDVQNHIIAKLLAQIETSKLKDKKIKQQLGQLKDREIEARLSNLKRNNNFNNDYYNNNNNFGLRPTGNLPGAPSPPPLQELRMKVFIRLLAQQYRYSHHLELTLQHLHIWAKYLHRQIIILCLQKELPLLIQIQI